MLHGCPIAVAPLVVEHAFPAGFVVTAHGLTCSEARGIFLDPGLSLCSLSRRWILKCCTARKVLSDSFFF